MMSSKASASHRLSLGQSSNPTAIPSHSFPILNSSSSSSSSNPNSNSIPLITPTTLTLSAPSPNSIDHTALHFLTIEMKHTLAQSTKYARKRREKALKDLDLVGLNIEDMNKDKEKEKGKAKAEVEREKDEEELEHRLQAIGVHVGANIADRLSRDRPPFATPLDVLKFVCKEVWSCVWDKQVDNLRTNHRGVYVLQDNAFKPLLRMSTSLGKEETSRLSKPYLAYPIGIVKGALQRLGVPSSVVVETNQLPQCTFHVKTTVGQKV